MLPKFGSFDTNFFPMRYKKSTQPPMFVIMALTCNF